MITTTDVSLILYEDCKTCFGLDTCLGENLPSGELTQERVVIHSKKQTPEKIWAKSFVEVNLCVPDIQGESHSIRLQELERESQNCFHSGVVGEYDGTPYFYSISSIGIETDKTMKCHYVNVRIMFQVLNVE